MTLDVRVYESYNEQLWLFLWQFTFMEGVMVEPRCLVSFYFRVRLANLIGLNLVWIWKIGKQYKQKSKLSSKCLRNTRFNSSSFHPLWDSFLFLLLHGFLENFIPGEFVQCSLDFYSNDTDNWTEETIMRSPLVPY